MGLRVRFIREPEYVAPKTEDLEIGSVEFPDILGYEPKKPIINTPEPAKENTSKESSSASNLGSEWLDLTLSVDLTKEEKVVEVVSEVLEKIDRITSVFVVVLKILRILSSDLRNISFLLKLALKVVIKQLKSIIEGLTSLGFYACIINPDFDTKRQKFAMPINGGFKEFQSRVNASLLNSTDPGAPKFQDSDTVGGVILAGIAGINDPNILANLIENFKVLSNFFPFKGFNIQPPKGLRAIPGHYRKDRKSAPAIGVKLTWTHPGEYVSGFEVTRNIGNSKGTYIETVTGSIIEVFDNKDFNGGEIAEVKQIIAKTKYEYIDFDVKAGETYFYKVYSYIGPSSEGFFENNPDLKNLNSAVASKSVRARPVAKIPLSVLASRSLLDDRGMVVPPLDLAGEWKSISMRTFLGPAIDKLFDKIDNISDILEGSISTGSDALNNYIKFMEKKIKKIIKIIDSIEDIIKTISQFSFKGTLALLKLPPEEGGMNGLSQRFDEACAVPSTPDNENPFNGSDEQGIMFGLILVFGFPSLDGEYFQKYFKPVKDVGEDGAEQIQKSIKAVETVLGLLGLS